jgi:hypothetical protein
MSALRPSPRPHAQGLRRSVWVAGGLLLAGALVTATVVCSRGPEGRGGQASGNPPKVQKQFFYHAGALAVGGTVRRLVDGPPSEALLGQGAVVLPPSGGKGVADVKGFSYGDPKRNDAIRVVSAHSEVTGVRKEGACYETTSHSILGGIEILGRLKASEAEVQLLTVHCLDRGEDTTFRTQTARFKDLTIDNVPIEVRPVAAFEQGQTLADLIAQHRSPRGRLLDFDGRPAEFDSPLPPRRSDRAGHPVFEDRLFMTSLFERVGEKELAELERGNTDPKRHFALLPGNGIYIPNFGKVYFGRMMISRSRREAALLHLEMGSPMQADLDLGFEFGNGVEFP